MTEQHPTPDFASDNVAGHRHRDDDHKFRDDDVEAMRPTGSGPTTTTTTSRATLPTVRA